jgi:ABC-type dipeptide/oligopeptide/nickel transport system permease component
LLWFFTLWGVVTLVFLLFFGLSSDAVESALGQNSDEKTRQAIRTKWGLDQPLSVQYLQTLNRLSPVGFHPTDSTSMAFSGVWVGQPCFLDARMCAWAHGCKVDGAIICTDMEKD